VDVVELFAKNIRTLRQNLDLSQEELAELAGLHRTYIGAVERAEKNVTLRSGEKIARALGVSLSECIRE